MPYSKFKRTDRSGGRARHQTHHQHENLFTRVANQVSRHSQYWLAHKEIGTAFQDAVLRGLIEQQRKGN